MSANDVDIPGWARTAAAIAASVLRETIGSADKKERDLNAAFEKIRKLESFVQEVGARIAIVDGKPAPVIEGGIR